MSEFLSDHLPLVATANGGVGKIRQLILELAMRGRLVSQDPNDEPADQLLKEIQAEKLLLIRQKKVKQLKPLPNFRSGKVPYRLPATWAWARLDDVGVTNIGLTYSPRDISDHGIPVLRSNNIQEGKLDLSNLVRVTIDVNEKLLVNEGDLLICARNGSRRLVGKTAVIGQLQEKTAFGAFMAIFRSRLNSYIYYFMNSPLFRTVIDEVGTTTINQLTQNNLRSTLVPIPPLREQHRIVAKVNELMSLCDRLDAHQNDAEIAHILLVKELLDATLRSKDQNDFAENWQRIKENFDTLFTTEASIDALKETILQLAVMGKLVTQDLNDEPANDLLKRIGSEQRSLATKPNKLRQKKSKNGTERATSKFELPESWTWAKLADIVVFGPRNGYSPKSVTHPTAVKVLTLSATTTGAFDATKYKYVDEVIDEDSTLWLNDDDILLQRGNTREYVGISAVYVGPSKEYIYPDLMIKVRVSGHMSTRYVHMALNCKSSREYFMSVASGTSGTMPKIDQAAVMNTLLPIPPLAEQHRIVARIDELAALCNDLKTRISNAYELQETVASTLIENALNGGKTRFVEEPEKMLAVT